MDLFSCKNCSVEKPKGKNTFGMYCSNQCQQDYQNTAKVTKWLAEGNWVTKNKQLTPWIKRYVRERDGCCVSCGIAEWNGSPITLDVDHIDGIWYNNNVDNLRSLCPNCHSQTSTYKNKNIGNGRTLLQKS